MSYTLVPTELIVDGAITSAKLDTNIAISGTLGVTGEVTLATHLNMGDNDKIKIGTGGDLEIYHDGSNSYISNSTGNIYLGDTNGSVHIQAKLNEESIICAADGAVSLYHDNAVKLATSSAGITVTGTLTATTLAGTLSTAAQTNITSVGTLTSFRSTGIDDNADATAITIDSSENVLVGKSVANTSTVGIEARENGLLVATRDSGQPLLIDRLTDDGDLVLFRKDSSTVGSIGTTGGDMYVGTGDTGIRFDDATNHIRPCGVNGANLDATIDIGDSSRRFKDLYLSGSVTTGAGTAASPAIKVGDGDTGIWHPADNILAFSTWGSERMRIDSVGETTLKRAGSGGSGVLKTLNLNHAGTSVNDGAKISFTAGTSTEGAGISSTGQALNSADLRFYAGGNTERMRIDSSGNVGIGTSNCVSHLSLGNPSADGTIDYTKGITFIDTLSSYSSAWVHAAIVATGSSGYGGNLIFATDGDGNRDDDTSGLTEKMRITAGGFTKHSNTGVYDTYSGADDSHQFVSDNANHSTLWVTNTNASYATSMLRLESARSASTAFNFLTATTGNLTDDQFLLRGDGNAYADGSWNGGGADYAEYFEWSDGNTTNEDRRGQTIVLVENKIRKATSEDNQNNIIGVVSGNPSVVGDSDVNSWKNKYQKDDYGSYIKDENGDRIINDEYDETQDYVSREDRQEWDIIGLMGKVRINKGQTVGDRWIKMRDISDTIEEWLIK